MKAYLENNRKKYKEKTKELDKVYSEVIKKFPDIKKGEIKLKYLASVPYAELNIVDLVEYLVWGRLVKDPSITAGNLFFEVNKKEREAIIAHELGHYKRHYKRHKKYGTSKIEKHLHMIQEVNTYRKTETGETPTHKMAMMIKCLTLHEIYADNEALKAGYCKPLLSFLKMAAKKHKEQLPRLRKEALELRIKNLEEKLSEKK